MSGDDRQRRCKNYHKRTAGDRLRELVWEHLWALTEKKLAFNLKRRFGFIAWRTSDRRMACLFSKQCEFNSPNWTHRIELTPSCSTTIEWRTFDWHYTVIWTALAGIVCDFPHKSVWNVADGYLMHSADKIESNLLIHRVRLNPHTGFTNSPKFCAWKFNKPKIWARCNSPVKRWIKIILIITAK